VPSDAASLPVCRWRILLVVALTAYLRVTLRARRRARRGAVVAAYDYPRQNGDLPRLRLRNPARVTSRYSGVSVNELIAAPSLRPRRRCSWCGLGRVCLLYQPGRGAG